MTRLLGSLLALMVTAAPTARAQDAGPLIKYGKWVLAAGAVGMNYLAARPTTGRTSTSTRSGRAASPTGRSVRSTTSGRYLDGKSEALYQASLHHDRNARRWLVGGRDRRWWAPPRSSSGS